MSEERSSKRQRSDEAERKLTFRLEGSRVEPLTEQRPLIRDVIAMKITSDVRNGRLRCPNYAQMEEDVHDATEMAKGWPMRILSRVTIVGRLRNSTNNHPFCFVNISVHVPLDWHPGEYDIFDDDGVWLGQWIAS